MSLNCSQRRHLKMKITGSFLILWMAIIVLATSVEGGVMRRLRHKPTRQPTARAEPTVNANNSLKPTKQSLFASTPPPNQATCLLNATVGTNGCSSSAPYCVSGLIGPTCSVCTILKDGTSVGCTNEGETCGTPSCVRDLPLSCKVDHEALCPSKRPTSMTPTTRKPITMKPTTRKPRTMKPTTLNPRTMKPTSRKPRTMKPTTLNPRTLKPRTMKPTTMKPTKAKPSTLASTPLF